MVAAVVALSFAAAGPFVDLREVEVRWRGVDLVVALDVSQSMAVRDAPPDRLHAARDAIRSLVDDLPGTRVALVLFAANGLVRYPPTTDPKVIADSLDSPGRTFRPTSGSSLRAAIDAAVDAFPSDSALPKAVLVVSDGEDVIGDRPDLVTYRAKNIRLFGLTVGTPEGGLIPTYDSSGKEQGPLVDQAGTPIVSHMHEELLRGYAVATGGDEWHYDGSPASLHGVAAALLGMGSGDLTGRSEQRPDDRYQLLALVALAAILAEWIVSERRAMPWPRRARVVAPRRAATVGTLLLLALVLGACADAAATNETANGLYASGDYEGALARYRGVLREHPELAEVSVNAGNALQQLRQFDRALSNYEAALSSPDRLRTIATRNSTSRSSIASVRGATSSSRQRARVRRVRERPERRRRGRARRRAERRSRARRRSPDRAASPAGATTTRAARVRAISSPSPMRCRRSGRTSRRRRRCACSTRSSVSSRASPRSSRDRRASRARTRSTDASLTAVPRRSPPRAARASPPDPAGSARRSGRRCRRRAGAR
jgi:Ca-activated chloride channel family protein